MQAAPTRRSDHAVVTAVRGYTRLVFDGVERMTSLVEAMHHNIARRPWPWQSLDDSPAPGITGFVYASIRGTTNLIREGVDSAFALMQPLLPPAPGSAAEEGWRAAVNGVVGDHLAATDNPLAVPMRFRRDGKVLPLARDALAARLPEAGNRLLIVIHGLCMNDLQWTRNGHNHAEKLARDLGCTPVYLHYNSGRHVSENGREFAALLEQLVEAWPVRLKSVDILAHSMGGLVARSAHYYARKNELRWPAALRRLVFLGTPHHGAPLERHGNRFQLLVGISPYTAPLARLGMLRSAGVTDLRHGNLLDEDWRDCDRFAPRGDCRRPLPLPEGVEVFVAAATLGRRAGDAKDRWLADGLVPLDSALGRHLDPTRHLSVPETRQWTGFEMNHWALLEHPALYDQILRWLN